MTGSQAASWHGVMDLHEQVDFGWTIIGGQLVHLFAAERGQVPQRPTSDVDTVIDVRADPKMLQRVTEALRAIEFEPNEPTGDGLQYRWVRGDAQIDILLPDGVGERTRKRTGVTGSPTLETPGGTQALLRSETVAVTLGDRDGFVRRPNLIGALIVKAAAHTAVGDPAKGRHRSDFLALAGMVAARDFAEQELTSKDKRRLISMIAAVRSDGRAMSEVSGAEALLDRLVKAAGLA